jgi:endonuclease/exonuclease/phosphatase (EEP) superfamily protein YafD
VAFSETERQAQRTAPRFLSEQVGRIQWFGVRTLIVWAYTGLLGLWWVLHVSLGDRLWWIALLSLFAPYLFAPLVLLVPLGLIKPRVRYWGAVLLALALLMLEYGRPLNVRAADLPRDADEITILTFNVWAYSDSEDTVQAIVSQGTPDVVVLQELSPSLVPALIEELGAVYPYRLLDSVEGPAGSGILSRYPVRQACLSDSSLVGGFAQVAELEVGERVFTLYNVHLDATSALYYVDSGGAVGERIRGSFEVRERQVAELVADLAERQGPVLVAGDLNMTEQTDAYTVLVHSLKDTHREVGRGLGHTFPAYAGSWRGLPVLRRMVRIDMVLHSAEWTALECQVLDEHGQSDHLPVLARLALARAAPPIIPL